MVLKFVIAINLINSTFPIIWLIFKQSADTKVTWGNVQMLVNEQKKLRRDLLFLSSNIVGMTTVVLVLKLLSEVYFF